MLLAIRPIGVKSGSVHFLFKCDCGNEAIISGHHVISGRQISCGCVHRQVRHGMAHHPGYQNWRAMIRRCTDVRVAGYKNYGGRGITVCERWLNSCENFILDMGPRPTPLHSIERRDYNGPYSPDNCYWALPVQQARNTRNNRIVEWKGRKATIVEWAEMLGIKYSTLRMRLERGYSLERAMHAKSYSTRTSDPPFGVRPGAPACRDKGK